MQYIIQRKERNNMKLKKINAILSLFTTLALFVHIGYTSYAYLTFYYNPFLKNLTSIPLMVFVCLHAVLAMGIVFFSADGTKLSQYPKQNAGTVLQRVSAILILPLLFLHINTFDLLKNCAGDGKWFYFVLLLISQPVFYATVFTHCAVSVSRALITLGLLSSLEKKKMIDRFVFVLCAVFFIAVSFAVIKGELSMFLTQGGSV